MWFEPVTECPVTRPIKVLTLKKKKKCNFFYQGRKWRRNWFIEDYKEIQYLKEQFAWVCMPSGFCWHYKQSLQQSSLCKGQNVNAENERDIKTPQWWLIKEKSERCTALQHAEQISLISRLSHNKHYGNMYYYVTNIHERYDGNITICNMC